MELFSDTELVEAYRAGQERALVVLIQRYLPILYRFLFRLVGDTHVAQDLMQETFLKMWKHLGTYQSSKSFKTWMFTIARRSEIDHLRKKQPLLFSSMGEETFDYAAESIADDAPLPPEVLERQELAADIDQAMTHLSPKTKALLLMHEIEDMTFQEIADVLDEPMNTIKSRYRRAMQSVKQRLIAQETMHQKQTPSV